MGSLLKTSVVVGFLVLLPALVYCDGFVELDLFVDKNCTTGPQIPSFSNSYYYLSQVPNDTFLANPVNMSFQSIILTNYTGDVVSFVACQAGLECNATGAFQISFNLSDIGACSTAGPPGTVFDRFILSS